jgi:hypothetical protein
MKNFVPLSSVLTLLLLTVLNAFSQPLMNVKPSNVEVKKTKATETVLLTNNGSSNLVFTVKSIETSKNQASNLPGGSTTSDSPQDYQTYLNSMPAGVAWMNVYPSDGVIASGKSIILTLSFDAKNIKDNEILSAKILITSNALSNEYSVVNVNLYDGGNKGGGGTYITTLDNENNAFSGVADGDMDSEVWNYYANHPIEFNIFVDDPSITTAQLSVYLWDVDELSGENDQIYINGHLLGSATGNNGQWSTTVFNVPAAYIVPGPVGKNLVQIYVDVNNVGNPSWLAGCDWGQLVINDNTGGNAFIRYASMQNACYLPGESACINIEVDTDIPSQNIRVETNLLDPSNVAVDGSSNTYFISGTANEPLQKCFTIPGSATMGSTYSMQVIVYDAATNLQQDIIVVPIQVDICAPVPLSNWALYFGIFLIVVFSAIRFRKMI